MNLKSTLLENNREKTIVPQAVKGLRSYLSNFAVLLRNMNK